MKNLRHILSLLLLSSPLTALAHGEDVLMTIFLEFIVLVILVIGLLIINLTRTGKLIIGVIGILAIALTSIATNSLPYNRYRTMKYRCSDHSVDNYDNKLFRTEKQIQKSAVTRTVMEYFNKLVDARIIEMISDEPLPFQFMENGKKIKSSSDVEKYFAQRKL